jgi:integrase
MALAMPRPFATKSGSYYLNVRVPNELREVARGRAVTLPIADEAITVTISDKVYVSLRTKSARDAKKRFQTALGRLAAYWDSLRTEPLALTPVQVKALAGETYRNAVERLDADFDFGDRIGAFAEEYGATTQVFIEKGYAPQVAERLASIEMDDPRALHTYALRHGDGVMNRGEIANAAFGAEARQLAADNQMQLDEASLARVTKELVNVGRAFSELAMRRLSSADHSDEIGKNLPAWSPPTPAGKPSLAKADREPESIADLYKRWCAYQTNKKAASTLRRYGPSLESLDRFWKGKDWRLIGGDEIFDWANHRRDVDKIAPRTINRNDLVAVSSIFAWATTRQGGSKRSDNPAEGIKIDVEMKTVKREKFFKDEEVSAILTAARNAKPSRRYPRASASRRWAPWICAYTGARIQEVCWLSRKDIKQEGGIWVIHFPQTKTNVARTVPMHPALVDEGLLAFWDNAPAGFLFVGDVPQKEGATRSPQEQRASELAEWVQEQVKLEDGVSPNHGWRHTFVTRAEEANISKRFSNAITGHNHGKDVSDGYFRGRMSALKVRMDKYPRYEIVTP